MARSESFGFFFLGGMAAGNGGLRPETVRDLRPHLGLGLSLSRPTGATKHQAVNTFML